MSHGKDFGSIELDASGCITNFCEKVDGAGEPLVNAGIYCLNQEGFSFMPDSEQFSLERDFFPSLVGSQLYAYLTNEQFLDIGTPQRYESIKEKFNKGN